jgi:preprotein translocase subunit SecA
MVKYINDLIVNKPKKKKIVKVIDNILLDYKNWVSFYKKNSKNSNIIDKFKLLSDDDKILEIMKQFYILKNITIRREQLIAVYSLLEGNTIAEIQLSAGKTYIIAIYNILQYYKTNEPIYCASSSEYLSKRDYEDCKVIYEQFDIKSSYQVYNNSNIIYNSYYNFVRDYCADMLTFDDILQTKHINLVIDEIDAVLIDNAITPVTLSENRDVINVNSGDYLYLTKVDRLVNIELKLHQHYSIENSNQVIFTENGLRRIERLLKIDDLYNNLKSLHMIEQSILAKETLVKGRDYLVEDNRIILLDLKQNRLKNRVLVDGLQQALEIKEKCDLSPLTDITAKITYKNYFDLFKNRVGVTGTCFSEAIEFREIYGMHLIKIDDTFKNIAITHPDILLKTRTLKLERLIEDIKNIHNSSKRPIIIVAIDMIEFVLLSKLLNREKLKYNSLDGSDIIENNKQFENIATMNSITLVSSLVGRGVNIHISSDVEESGGISLHISSRNNIRREDIQLSGRVGRLGKSGDIRFYLSFEDRLLTEFGPKKLINIYNSLNYNNRAMSSTSLDKIITKAQKNSENLHFQYRKSLLMYDNIYATINKNYQTMRQQFLPNHENSIINNREVLVEKIQDLKDNYLEYLSKHSIEEDSIDFDILNKKLYEDFKIDVDFSNIDNNINNLNELVTNIFNVYMKERFKNISNNQFNDIVSKIYIFHINSSYRDLLNDLGEIEEAISWQSLANRDPLIEFQKRAYILYEDNLKDLKLQIFKNIMRVNS